MILSVLNISVAYILIRIYLKFKHSEAINIAEKTQWTMKVTLISFRHLAFGFYCAFTVGVYNFCVYQQNSYQNLQSVPPGNILVNFVCAGISLQFILAKKEILDFLKRRIANLWPDISIWTKKCPKKTQSLKTQNERRIAWNWQNISQYSQY